MQRFHKLSHRAIIFNIHCYKNFLLLLQRATCKHAKNCITCITINVEIERVTTTTYSSCKHAGYMIPSISQSILHSGSQSNFITDSLYSWAGFARSSINLPVIGIGQISSNLTQYCYVTLKSIDIGNSCSFKVQCMVMN